MCSISLYKKTGHIQKFPIYSDLYNNKGYTFHIISKTVYTYLSHGLTQLHRHNHPTGTMNVL